MTAVAMPFVDDFTPVVTSVDSTWTDCASIAAGSFTAGNKYLIIASGLLGCEASAGEHHVRLVHGTTPTEFTDAHQVYDPGTGLNIAWQYMTVWTQPGTAELIKIQIMREASTGNVTAQLVQLACVDITDLTENTDYWFNEVTADYETTTTPVAQASVTLTPNGTDDFAVWGCAVYDGGGTTVTDGNDFEAELFESVGSSVLPRWQGENEDVDAGDEIRSAVLQRPWAALSAAAHTFSVRLSHNGGAAFTNTYSSIFVLRLNAFAQHAIAYTAAADVPSTDPTWETEQTVSVTPDVTGNWFYSAVATYVHATGDSLLQRLQDDNDGSMGSDPAYGDATTVPAGWDLSDAIPNMMTKVKSLTSGASRTINYDFTHFAGTTSTVQDRCIVAFSAELAGAAAAAPGMVIGYGARPGRGPVVRRRRPYSYLPRTFAVTDISVALSGLAITSAQGTLGVAMAVPLTGTGLTAATGTLVPSAALALSGLSGTTAQGTLGVLFEVPLTGVGLAASTGTLGVKSESFWYWFPQYRRGRPGVGPTVLRRRLVMQYWATPILGDISVALSGLGMASVQGTLGVTMDVALIGAGLTLTAGSLAPSMALALTGTGLTSAAGTLGVASSVALSGLALAASTGTLLAAFTIPLSGVSITLEAGTLTPVITFDFYIWPNLRPGQRVGPMVLRVRRRAALIPGVSIAAQVRAILLEATLDGLGVYAETLDGLGVYLVTLDGLGAYSEELDNE